MKRSMVFTFPRPLTTDEEDYFISAFQESIMKPAERELRNQAKKFSSGFYGKVIDKTGLGIIVAKLEALAMDITNWMSLDKESETRYVFSYNVEALSAMTMDIPKPFQKYMGTKLSLGKFIPDKKIIRHFRRNIFHEMNLNQADVKIETI